ncbi:hypothetical protein SLS64_009338 [Diaporthe eres]
MRATLVVAASWGASIGLASNIEFPPNATEIFGPFVHDNGTLATWMSKHPDETPLELINIPGTHDSATWNYTQATQDALANITAGDGEPTYPPEVFRCQNASIMESLSAGVRFFDLRFALDPTGTKLVFWHSQALMSERATVGDVITAFYHWLDLHPSEMHMIFDILNSTTAAQYIDQTHDVLPTLGAARGKVVLFRRFDLDELPDEYEAALPGLHLSPNLWTDNSRATSLTYNTELNLTAYIEDYYEPDDLGDNSTAADNIAAKVNATVVHLETATSDNPDYDRSLLITFASAEHVTAVPVAVTPQIMALGADSYRCRSPQELRHYLDRRHEEDDDPFWDGPVLRRPTSLRLFFLPYSDDDGNERSPFSQRLPQVGFAELLCEKAGFALESGDGFDGSDEDEWVSPSSSPRQSAMMACSRMTRTELDTIDEEAETEDVENGADFRQSWIWEARYIRSTTQALADQDATTYFCINFPKVLQKRISDAIHSLTALAKNPLFLDTLIIDEVIAFYRDAIKRHRAQLLALNDDDSNSTDLSIKLEELSTQWRTILRDIQDMQAHIHELRSVAESRSSRQQERASMLHQHANYHKHTRQKSSDVFGPPATEILQLQLSTCDFWARCVTMYLERTNNRVKKSTYRMSKTIPLRRRGSLPQLNRRLSNFTIEVAVHIQRNSASVSTLAMSFLSTVFFSPDGLLFALTYWWWIIATLILPLTFVILHLWFETLATNVGLLRGGGGGRRKVERGTRLGGVAEDGEGDGEGEEGEAVD